MKKKSARKMSNKRRPSINLWGSPKTISIHVLYELFTLAFCFLLNTHCVKITQIRSCFWSVFSCIRTEYRKIQTRNNSVFGKFSRSEIVMNKYKVVKLTSVKNMRLRLLSGGHDSDNQTL